jgi:hypothetical protein
MHKKLLRLMIAGPTAALCLALSAHGDSLRCGTKLVSTGDLALQIREKCGDPISEELIGYTLRPARHSGDGNEREYKIEQWVYGPEQGYYHVLTFEAGRLRNIENIRQ